MNTNFGIELVKRNILTHGQKFTLMRSEPNRFKEPTGHQTEITILGLFHQTRGYISQNTTDGTVSRSKPQPMVLTLVDETSKSIRKGDRILYCTQIYKVVGINDVNNMGVALEISLELVDNGT